MEIPFLDPLAHRDKTKHCCVLMHSNRMSDGMLVSLARQGTQKGPLRYLEGTEPSSLSPHRCASISDSRATSTSWGIAEHSVM